MQILCITVVTHETNCRRTDISTIAHVGQQKMSNKKNVHKTVIKQRGEKRLPAQMLWEEQEH